MLQESVKLNSGSWSNMTQLDYAFVHFVVTGGTILVDIEANALVNMQLVLIVSSEVCFRKLITLCFGVKRVKMPVPEVV